MLDRLIKNIGRLQTTLGAIASLLLITLVLMMAYNVVARYAFSASSLGLEELSWHFYAAIFLLGIRKIATSAYHHYFFFFVTL